MALWAKQVTIGTTATRIDDPETAQNMVVLLCNRSDASIFVGGAGVTTSTGFELTPGDTLTIRGSGRQWSHSDGIYGVSTAGGKRIDRMQVSS